MEKHTVLRAILIFASVAISGCASHSMASDTGVAAIENGKSRQGLASSLAPTNLHVGTVRVSVEDKLQFIPAARPDMICGSPFECGRVVGVLACECRQSGERFTIEATLKILGRIHYYPFPALMRRLSRPLDDSISDVTSLHDHVRDWHVAPAISQVDRELASQLELSFASLEECQSRSTALSVAAPGIFNEAIRRTQRFESDGIDVAAVHRQDQFVIRPTTQEPPVAAVLAPAGQQ